MEIKIYYLKDPITNKIRYIGRTSRKLNERLLDHISSSHSNHNSYKKNWILKLDSQGLKPEIGLLKKVNCSWKESHKIEKDIIKEYFEKGCKLVNLVDKGCGSYGISIEKPSTRVPILQYDLEGNLIKEFDGIITASKEVHLDSRLIFKSLNEISIKSGNYMWKYKTGDNIPTKIDSYNYLKGKAKRKRVVQYDLNGNFIKIFESFRLAAEEIGVKSESNISEAVKEKYSLRNFQWREYSKNYLLNIGKYVRKKPPYRGISILAINCDNNTQIKFNSLLKAAKFFQVSSPTIRKRCDDQKIINNYKLYFN